jgi:hypothetical protein
LIASATHINIRFPGIVGLQTSESAAESSRLAAADALQMAFRINSWSFEAISQIDWDTTRMLMDLNHLSIKAIASERAWIQPDFIENTLELQRIIDSLIHRRTDSTTSTISSTSSSSRELAPPTGDADLVVRVRICALAGFIYVYLFLLRTPVASTVFDWMVSSVKRDFESMEVVIREMYTPQLLFWIMYTAGCAGVGRAEREWFRDRVAEIRDSLGLQKWDDARETLGKLAWVDLSDQFSCFTLWQELVGAAGQ